MVDGAAIHYLAWGDPACQPVVLVHGTVAHAEWWRFIAPLLLPQYHVIALDLGGMGDSDPRQSYERDDFVRQVMAVAQDAAPGRRPFIVGHSLGGFITLHVGHLHADELAGIIVLDSPVYPPGGEPPRSWTQRADQPNPVYASRAEAMSRFRLRPDQPCDNGFIFEHIAVHSIREVEGGWTWKFDPRALSSAKRHSYVDALLNMRCPAALFWGEHSLLFRDEVKDYVRSTFGSRIPLVEIRDAHHHLLLDQPIALAAAIETQLANWRGAEQAA